MNHDGGKTMDASEVNRVKFASQTDPKLLNELKAIAKAEGRQLQALIEDYIEKKHGGQMRPAVKSALERSMRERKWLYAQLAK
jgi:hypothetical protein